MVSVFCLHQLFVVFLLLWSFQEVVTKELKPIRPHKGKNSKLGKRTAVTDLDIRNNQTFLWGDEGELDLKRYLVALP